MHLKHSTLGFAPTLAFTANDDLCKGGDGLQNDGWRQFECVDALLETGSVIE